MQKTESTESNVRVIEIDVVKESLHFSAGHFTIFDATSRENLHGHNFRLQAVIRGEIDDTGLLFDYSIIKQILQELCDSLDERVLLPSRSPYLKLRKEDRYMYADFNDETLPFLHRDVLILPIRNITVEELSNWFLDKLGENEAFNQLPISNITIRVASGSGQWGVATSKLR